MRLSVSASFPHPCRLQNHPPPQIDTVAGVAVPRLMRFKSQSSHDLKLICNIVEVLLRALVAFQVFFKPTVIRLVIAHSHFHRPGGRSDNAAAKALLQDAVRAPRKTLAAK